MKYRKQSNPYPKLNPSQGSSPLSGCPIRLMPLWIFIFGGVGLIIAAAIGVAFSLVRGLEIGSPDSEPTPTELFVEVLPTPGSAAPGTTPLPATGEVVSLPPTATPTTVILPTPTPTEAAPADTLADVVTLVGNNAIAEPPQGVDIATCNIGADTLVGRSFSPPMEVAQATDKLVVWLKLNEAVPEGRTLTYHWLASLDMDNNTSTGRPAGDGYINPDLGAEIGAGVFLYADGELEPYLFIWDPDIGDWAADSEVPDIVEATLNESRDAVALSFPLVELNAAIEEIAGVSITPNTIKGRLATIASSSTEAAIVDYCPNLP